jgi:hypothetical protein
MKDTTTYCMSVPSRSSSTSGALASAPAGSLTTFRGQYVNGTDTLVFHGGISDTIPGDANLDGKVEVMDLYQLSTHWHQTGQTWATGDFNSDGLVDTLDLTILAAHWQEGMIW